jgi:hypothetical protein
MNHLPMILFELIIFISMYNDVTSPPIGPGECLDIPNNHDFDIQKVY